MPSSAVKPNPVLDGSQYAVHMLAVAFELEDGVDDMFQDFRAGNGSIALLMCPIRNHGAPLSFA